MLFRSDRKQPAVAGRLEARNPSHSVHMAGHKMPSEPVGKSQRFFKIHRVADRKTRRARERFIGNIRFEPGRVKRRDGEADAIHCNAVTG